MSGDCLGGNVWGRELSRENLLGNIWRMSESHTGLHVSTFSGMCDTVVNTLTDRQTDTERLTDTQTDRQTDRHRETHRHTDRQTDRHTETHRHTDRQLLTTAVLLAISRSPI